MYSIHSNQTDPIAISATIDHFFYLVTIGWIIELISWIGSLFSTSNPSMENYDVVIEEEPEEQIIFEKPDAPPPMVQNPPLEKPKDKELIGMKAETMCGHMEEKLEELKNKPQVAEQELEGLKRWVQAHRGFFAENQEIIENSDEHRKRWPNKATRRFDRKPSYEMLLSELEGKVGLLSQAPNNQQNRKFSYLTASN